MGKSSQRKGRAGELELVQLLRDHGIQAEPGKAVSIGTTPDITGVPGIHAEVKRVEKLNVHAALAQAAQDSEKFQDGAGTVPPAQPGRLALYPPFGGFLSVLQRPGAS